MRTVRGAKIILVLSFVLLALIIALILLLFIVVLSPVIIVLLILFRRKLRELWNDFKRGIFAWLCLSSYPIIKFIKFLKDNKRIVIKGDFPKTEKSALGVSNHPSWYDQISLFWIKLMNSNEWMGNLDSVPYIGVAEDSIRRLPMLKLFQAVFFIVPVVRHITRSLINSAEHAYPGEDILQKVLLNGNNLIVSGPPGRDGKAKDKEKIYSPAKNKQLRRFGGLCGRLAVLPGVTTVPIFITGIEKVSNKTSTGEIKFSLKNLLIDFLLLGKFQIVVIFGGPLTLQELPPEEARKIIEEQVLKLADLI